MPAFPGLLLGSVLAVLAVPALAAPPSAEEPTAGALGGSGLRYFKVTVDFAAGQAVFER
jgi:hypothetical protein